MMRTESFNVKNNNNDRDDKMKRTKTNEKMSQMRHGTNHIPIDNSSSANGCNKKHYEICHLKQTNLYQKLWLDC